MTRTDPSSLATAAGARPALLELSLRPHRSLTPRGFVVLMSTVGAISFAAGLAFYAAGAWPVIGFLGLDVLLIYLAFRLNYRSGKLTESLRLTQDRLSIKRVHPCGRQEDWDFQPHWLQVLIDLPLRHDSQLTLRSHGKSLVIGAFLPPRERLEVAAALHRALAGLRDGPQEIDDSEA